MSAHLHVDRGNNESQRWCIRHAGTGSIVIWGYRSRAAAVRELVHVSSLADWSRPVAELLDDCELRSRMQDEQVRVLHGRPIPANTS